MQPDLTHATTLLRQGGICVIPTDTLYGLVAQANNKVAVERVYTTKHRDKTKPCIVLIADMVDLKKFKVSLSPNILKTLSRVWPGPVSVVLPCTQSQPHLDRDQGSLAFRLPNNQWLREFLRTTGPLVAPSANPEGSPPATTIAEARAYFGDAVECYVDGGTLQSDPSTLIAFDEKGSVTVLRGTLA